jgi:drug/metabolite transporter (DMT)-like permease
LTLAAIVLARGDVRELRAGDWRGALALFVYAIAFAQAYVALDAGVGALLLFGAVQLTMLIAARWRGERFAPWQWLGLTLAALGLAAMKLPIGPVSLPWSSTLAMLLAGVAWGVNSLLGRGAVAPLRHTAGNFLRAAPLAIVFALSEAAFVRADAPFDRAGIGYAIASGALASGLGYALWYAALPRLLASQAALLQLLVPLLAALGGVLLLGERIDARLVLGGAAILGGVALALRRRQQR